MILQPSKPPREPSSLKPVTSVYHPRADQQDRHPVNVAAADWTRWCQQEAFHWRLISLHYLDPTTTEGAPLGEKKTVAAEETL